MAVGTSLPAAPLVPGADDGQVVAYDRYIETQLLRTRRHVKSVDLAGAIMRLVVGSLVYLLLAAVVDQWLVPGGLGFVGRLVTLLLFLTGLVSFAALWLGPLVLRRINPVFAAHTIESSQPGMKNSLINFLLLRSSPEGLAQRIYQAMEEQAVSGLTTVSVESAVDRTPLIRLLYALLAIVALAAVYQVASPKSPMASIRRVLAPWADIAPPTRVVIDEILPGNAEKYHDQLLTVSALVKGLKAGEPVTLHYWTGDGQVVDGRVGMSLPELGYRYQAELPPGGTGLQQDMEYTITAGDAVSQRYRIEVRTAPSVVVTELTYDYPPYTKLPQRVVERQGDIQALEGTQVTVRAAASHDIKSVHLDFDCNGSRDQEMKIDGRQASAAFPLLLKAKSDQPEHASYQLRFTNTNGDENPKPVRYTIEVQRDEPPEIAVVEPRPDGDEELTLRLGSPLKLAFEALDPDFELSAVSVHARRGKVTLFNHSMLAEPRAGRYDGQYLFNSGAHKLKAGDEVEFWISADDNRQPQPNHTETSRIKVRIVPPDGEQAANDKQRADGQPPPQDQNQRDENSRPQENQRGKRDSRPKGTKEEEASADESPDAESSNAESKRDGEKGRNRRVRQPEQDDNGNGAPRERNAGEASQEPPSEPSDGQNQEPKQDDNQRVDPENDPGRAVEQINKHFEDSPREPKPSDGKNEPKQKSDDARGNPSEVSSNDRPPESNSSKPAPGKGPNKQSPSDKRSPNQPDPKQDRSGAAGDEEQPKDGDSPMPGETPPEGERNQDRNAKPAKEKGDQAQPKPSAADTNEPGQPDKKKPKSKPKSDEKRGQGNQAAGDQGNTNDGDGKDPQGGEKGTPGNEKPKPGKKSSPGQAGEKSEGDQSAGTAPENGAHYDNEAPETKDVTADKPENAKPKGKGKPPKGETPPGETGAAGEQGADEESDGSQAQSDHASPGGNKSKVEKQEKKKEKGDDALVGDQEAQAGDEEGNDPKGEQAGQVRGHNDETEKRKENAEKNEGTKGGSTSDPKDDGGAGEAGGNPKGSPDNQGPNAPREKKLDSSGAVKPNEPDKAESPSQSKNQSDSKGGADGDLSGGGDGGGGQKANTKGSGAPGKNEAADEGGGLSSERGAGAAGNDAGNKEKGDKPQGGQGAQEKGPGAKTRPGGKKAGGAASKQSTPNGPQDNADAKEGDGESPKPATDRDPDGQPKLDTNRDDQRPADGSGLDQPPDQQGKPDPDGQPDAKGGLNPGQKQGGRGAPTGGGGIPGSDDQASEPAAPAAGAEPGGDDPNLDFARKATDLAIERLKDQLAKDKPDPDLLERLKWSREDMEQFVRRWEELKRSAKEPGERGKNGREELDAALRNLGLHAKGSMVKGGKTRDDQNRGLSESRRIPPPAEYADQYREFSKGTAKGRPAKEK
ncbi:MAG TPA: hypothetical protein VGX78_11440 [Pirellulales bacterium]|nr:hypothetical protein [Pirellulales bacterium]